MKGIRPCSDVDANLICWLQHNSYIQPLNIPETSRRRESRPDAWDEGWANGSPENKTLSLSFYCSREWANDGQANERMNEQEAKYDGTCSDVPSLGLSISETAHLLGFSSTVAFRVYNK